MADLKSLSRNDIISILGIVERARVCDSPASFRELILNVKDLLDAEYAICGSASVAGAEVRSLVSAINGNIPEAWLGHYSIEEFTSKDPVLGYHARFSRPAYWSEALGMIDTDPARKVFNHAADFGLKYGISTGIYVPEREEICVCSFSGGRDVFKGRHKEVLDILSLHLNNAYTRAATYAGGLLIKERYKVAEPQERLL